MWPTIARRESCLSCYAVVANGSSVKGGTYFPITVKKHLRAQEIAQENSTPGRPKPLGCLLTVARTTLYIPRRLGWCESPTSGRGLPRPRELWPHFLQSGKKLVPLAKASCKVVHLTRCSVFTGNPSTFGGHGAVYSRWRLRSKHVRRIYYC